jgi:hypothetical protein
MHEFSGATIEREGVRIRIERERRAYEGERECMLIAEYSQSEIVEKIRIGGQWQWHRQFFHLSRHPGRPV